MRSKLLLKTLTVAACLLVTVGCGDREPVDESLTGNVADLVPEAPAEPGAEEKRPEMTVVLHADPHVVVSLVTLEPGTELADHRGEDRVAYGSVAGALGLERDGETTVHELKRGRMIGIDDGPVTFGNAGSEPLAMVLFSRSDVDLPELPPGSVPFDRDRVDPAAELLFEGHPIAFRSVLGAGEALPLPGAAMWLAYAETDADLALRTGDLDDVPIRLETGEVHASTDSLTELTNAGTQPATLVIVVYPASTADAGS